MKKYLHSAHLLLSIQFLMLLNLLSLLEASPAIVKKTREEELLNLIANEKDALEKVKKRGPELDYRYFELMSEEAKILKRYENQQYLLTQLDQKQKTDQKDAKNPPQDAQAVIAQKNNSFPRALKALGEAQEQGLSYLKRYPQSRQLAKVYYGLASNRLEVNNDVEKDQSAILQWLKLGAEKKITAEEGLMIQAKLAEVHYVLKNYQLALEQYQAVTRKKFDQWHAKHLLNRAWCHFQLKNFPAAIEQALLSFKESVKDRAQGDLTALAADGLIYFYVFHQQPGAALEFHRRLKDLSQEQKLKAYLKTLNLTKKFISAAKALEIEPIARQSCQQHKDVGCLFYLSAFLLNIHKESKNYVAHFAVSQQITDEIGQYLKQQQRLTEQEDFTDQLAQVINNMAEQASTLQQFAYKDHYIAGSAEQNYQLLGKYYDLLKTLNPIKSAEYSYLLGELSLKEQKWSLAKEAYGEAHQFLKVVLNQSKVNQNQNKKIFFTAKLWKSQLTFFETYQSLFEGTSKTSTSQAQPSTRKILLTAALVRETDLERQQRLSAEMTFLPKLYQSMMSLVNEPQYADSEFFAYVHESYLNDYPSAQTSVEMYKQLFKFYHQERKSLPEAENLIDALKYHRAADRPLAQEMLKVVLNEYIQQKRPKDLHRWILALKSGYLNFDQKFIDENIYILGRLIFEKAQQLEQQGLYAQAIVEYEAIVKQDQYPLVIRTDSLYHAALNHLQLDQSVKSLEALKRLLKLAPLVDQRPYVERFVQLGKRYILLQAMGQGAWLLSYLFEHHCQELKERDQLATLLSDVSLQLKRAASLEQLQKLKQPQCLLSESSAQQVRRDYLAYLLGQQSYRQAVQELTRPPVPSAGIAQYVFEELWQRYWLTPAMGSELSALLEEQFIKLNEFSFLDQKYRDQIKRRGETKAELAALEQHYQHLRQQNTYAQTLPLKPLQELLTQSLEGLAKAREQHLDALEKIEESYLYQAKLFILVKHITYDMNRYQQWQLPLQSAAADQQQWKALSEQVQSTLKEQLGELTDLLKGVYAQGQLPIHWWRELAYDRDVAQFTRKGGLLSDLLVLTYRSDAKPEVRKPSSTPNKEAQPTKPALKKREGKK